MEVKICRFYIDGCYGTGKSTAALNFIKLEKNNPVYYFPEPMAFWRIILETDIVQGIYSVQDRKLRGELSLNDASLITAQLQTKFSTPYILLHSNVSKFFGENVTFGIPEVIFIFDRHPIASIVCFPLARYLIGDMTLESVISIITTLPKETPGGNLVITDLSEDELLQRLKKRSRKGEKIDLNLLHALQNVYTMLINTKRFLELNDWYKEWDKLPVFNDCDKNYFLSQFCLEKDKPSINDTLFRVFKTSSLVKKNRSPFIIYKWALEKLVDSLENLKIFKVSFQGSPDVCVSNIREIIPHMTITSTSKRFLQNLIETSKSFSKEMYCD
ncbi:nucleotide metabolism protein [Canid alphaherpesvirus 1]|nr:nucleotide metabolism protein [Canid alphaherpesvirus 1]